MGAPGQDFERLYQIVANHIKSINQNVNQIATMVKTMGNPSRDSHDMRIKLRDMIDDTKRIAAEANKSFKDLSHVQTMNPVVRPPLFPSHLHLDPLPCAW
jgi:hypothetical protein